MTDITIRMAERADLPALLDIYNHYILTTPITFDIEPRTLAQRQAWFEQFSVTGKYRCFVAARADEPSRLGLLGTVQGEGRLRHDHRDERLSRTR